jgi:hypothetical protein
MEIQLKFTTKKEINNLVQGLSKFGNVIGLFNSIDNTGTIVSDNNLTREYMMLRHPQAFK